ncbi:hypothetical protein AMAG_01631 [Allomyces macrogynus ATCC 38327]|uniref:Lysophospholipid acyltransferase 5 n=1 Tax=Allomyces macrogynus (strain ATCC 38327) TaxID=578462 RepID=A0A0L0S090_ALLM3|nr:hypothetical protein AMAG_01631 [Allomyces macrogynus ATCC 38327]|eukprot:KNE55754.1 hypothetical protein AMAG_01631 [Allomyces macrogynus ATCC 38327]
MVVHALADASGIPEPTLRLLLAVLAAYPAALVQRALLTPKVGASTRNAVNVVLGLAIASFFCGTDLVHSLATISTTWTLCKLGEVLRVPPKSRWLVAAASFIFNFAYLLIAYYFHASESYDINWTTPQSVLTLRMIGFAFDWADGAKHLATKPPATSRTTSDSGTDVKGAKSAQAKPTAATPPARVVTEDTRVPTAWAGDLSLVHVPSYLETLGFAYFTGSFLVGPQFSFALYRKYLSLDLFATYVPMGAKEAVPVNVPVKTLLKSSAGYAAKTFAKALLYLGVTQVLQMYFTSSVVLAPEFATAPYYERLYLAWWCGKTALTKYVGIWLLTDGSCALSGLSFDGLYPDGQTARWTGLSNIRAWAFESATSLGQIIAHFNINTNHWAKLYLFKRLKFLGNKQLSALGTLSFLAIWHGFHPGYAFAFALEFVDMEAERRLTRTVAPLVKALSASAAGRVLVNVTCWLLTTSALYYAALGFDLLTFQAIWQAFNALYWVGHIAVVVVLLITFIVPGPKRGGVSAAKKTQ